MQIEGSPLGVPENPIENVTGISGKFRVEKDRFSLKILVDMRPCGIDRASKVMLISVILHQLNFLCGVDRGFKYFLFAVGWCGVSVKGL